jgi:hypothetical protein
VKKADGTTIKMYHPPLFMRHITGENMGATIKDYDRLINTVCTQEQASATTSQADAANPRMTQLVVNLAEIEAYDLKMAEEYDKENNLEHCKEKAAKLGLEVKIANDKQLFIDIDTEHNWDQFSHQIELLKTKMTIESMTVTPSKDGLPHRHVVIEMPFELPPIGRVALQACLGSDPTRELLSTFRAIKGEEGVSVFFEKEAL